MPYYHDLITDKSWQYLQELKKHYRFTLIGGWAVYLYAKTLKSKDIDFICDYETLEKLKTAYELIKNDRLKKYEIKQGEFDIDIYTPFFSDLGIPAEELEKMRHERDGFSVLSKEALLILKQRAYSDRMGTAKGEKDRLDILALLISGVDFKKYTDLLIRFNLVHLDKQLLKLIAGTREAPELGLTQHACARFKKGWMKELL
jgi:hypothetical protein